jgi:hypothetical protein
VFSVPGDPALGSLIKRRLPPLETSDEGDVTWTRSATGTMVEFMTARLETASFGPDVVISSATATDKTGLVWTEALATRDISLSASFMTWPAMTFGGRQNIDEFGVSEAPYPSEDVLLSVRKRRLGGLDRRDADDGEKVEDAAPRVETGGPGGMKLKSKVTSPRPTFRQHSSCFDTPSFV